MKLSEQLENIKPDVIYHTTGDLVHVTDYERMKQIAIVLSEALEHPWLLEELECSCGFYGDDSEETGMSECAKCLIIRVRTMLDRAKLKESK